MNITKIKFEILFLFALCVVFISCEDNPISSPPEIPIETLLSSPDTILINNQEIFLATYL